MTDLAAIGVDGCRSGWIALAARDPGDRRPLARHLGSFDELLEWRSRAGDEAIVAVDLPIGLTAHGGPRGPDRQARARLGERRGSVFTPPGRNLLDAAEFAEVQARVAAARAAGDVGHGLSRQAFGLLPKIREVDELLPSLVDHERWLVEVHPEVSFREWAGRELRAKRSAAGMAARLRLVLERFPGLLGDENLDALSAPEADVDLTDVLDAAAALWSGLRWLAGEAEVLGDDERDELGTVMRIVT